MSSWRFDQGRLDYFQFDEVKRIASALANINGISKPTVDNDLLRKILSQYSSRPFAPTNYTVWRNYKRVFGCLLLATEITGKIICTELCNSLATNPNDVDIDNYLGHFATHFYYPSPVFDGYDTTTPQIFPVIAVIKFLLCEYLTKGKPVISIDEIGSYLIANRVSGLEPINFYQTLQPKPIQDDLRQVRELVKFISQFSFLKWSNPKLFLETSSQEEARQLEKLLTPKLSPRHAHPSAELLDLGGNFNGTAIGDLTISQANVIDTEFTEGNKIRATHLRTERSTKLKEFYFTHMLNPNICDMCTMDATLKYPWTERLIELHHLLPLSSPIRVEASTSSLKDIVGVCPSCHRATHKFYAKWLKDNSVRDFQNYEEARQVYMQAKEEIVLS